LLGKKGGCSVCPSSTVRFNFFFQIASSPTHNVNILWKALRVVRNHKLKFSESNCELYNPQYTNFIKLKFSPTCNIFWKISENNCGLYNLQYTNFLKLKFSPTCNIFWKISCIVGCKTCNYFQKILLCGL